MADKRAHLYISGKVQGVYYRANTRDEAREKGLEGWVKNLDDGRVEAVFEGEREKIEDMIEWCRSGSPAADVDDVEIEWEDAENRFDGFEIRY